MSGQYNNKPPEHFGQTQAENCDLCMNTKGKWVDNKYKQVCVKHNFIFPLSDSRYLESVKCDDFERYVEEK